MINKSNFETLKPKLSFEGNKLYISFEPVTTKAADVLITTLKQSAKKHLSDNYNSSRLAFFKKSFSSSVRA